MACFQTFQIFYAVPQQLCSIWKKFRKHCISSLAVSKFSMRFNFVSIISEDLTFFRQDFRFWWVVLFRVFRKLEEFNLPALQSSASSLCHACAGMCFITGISFDPFTIRIFPRDSTAPLLLSSFALLWKFVHVDYFPAWALAGKMFNGTEITYELMDNSVSFMKGKKIETMLAIFRM